MPEIDSSKFLVGCTIAAICAGVRKLGSIAGISEKSRPVAKSGGFHFGWWTFGVFGRGLFGLDSFGTR